MVRPAEGAERRGAGFGTTPPGAEPDIIAAHVMLSDARLPCGVSASLRGALQACVVQIPFLFSPLVPSPLVQTPLHLLSYADTSPFESLIGRPRGAAYTSPFECLVEGPVVQIPLPLTSSSEGPVVQTRLFSVPYWTSTPLSQSFLLCGRQG